MEIQAIANLFSALRDGEIQDLRMEDQNLQFRVHLPQLAALRGEGFQYFLCAFQGLKALSFQPFRNEHRNPEGPAKKLQVPDHSYIQLLKQDRLQRL